MIKTTSVDLERFKGALGFSPVFRCQWGNTRKAKLENVKLRTVDNSDPQLAAAEEKKAKARMKLNKQLINSPEYEKIKKFFGQVRQDIEALTVPSFFRDGFRLATARAVDAIETRMSKAAQTELPALVAALVKVFPGQVDEARSVLEPVGQFNPLDYPNAEALPNLFSISWNWVSFAVPEGLPPGLRAAEQEKMERQFAEAAEEVKTALRIAFAELVDHATERLTVEPGAKPRVFRDSLIENVNAFLDTFASRNIMADADLAALVEKARTVTNGLNAQKIRDYAAIREKARTGFAAIQTTLDGMIGDRPSRRITLDEEEPTTAATEQPELAAA